MSGRPGFTEKRLSENRFQQLPDINATPANSNGNSSKMAGASPSNPNDATIDIPLTPIPSRGQTGARKLDSSVSIPAYPQPADGYEDEKAAQEGGGKGGRRRKRINTTDARQAEDPADGTIIRMGRFYTAILNFSVITRYFLYVLPLAALLAIPIIIGATAAPNAKIGGVRIVWFFTWIEVVWLSLWISKIVAHFLPIIFQFLCGIVSSGTRKYALILSALEIPLSLVGWSVASLASFIPVCHYLLVKGRETKLIYDR